MSTGMKPLTATRTRQVGMAWMAVAILALCCAGAAAAASFSRLDPVVEVFAVAAVPGERVTLQDIAEPTRLCTAEEWAGLSLVPLWPAPARGAQVRLSREQLMGLLEKYLGPASRKCRLPDQLLIRGAAGVVREAGLAAMAAKFLTGRAAAWGGEAKVRDLRLPQHIFIDAPGDRVECTATSDIDPGFNSLRFQVVDPAGNVVRGIGASAVLDVWKAVPVASRPLNRKETLAPGDVTFARKNLAYLRHRVWDGQGGSWRLKTPVGREQVIYESSLEPKPVVAQGEAVTLVFEGENIVLRVPARALQDANHGETVTVQNLQSNRKVYARVRDSGTVVVR